MVQIRRLLPRCLLQYKGLLHILAQESRKIVVLCVCCLRSLTSWSNLEGAIDGLWNFGAFFSAASETILASAFEASVSILAVSVGVASFFIFTFINVFIAFESCPSFFALPVAFSALCFTSSFVIS